MQQSLIFNASNLIDLIVFVIEYPKQLELFGPNEFELNEQEWADQKKKKNWSMPLVLFAWVKPIQDAIRTHRLKAMDHMTSSQWGPACRG